MPVIIDGTSGVTTPTYGGADTSEYLVPVTQFKNRIINGAMVIDQRNAGASVTPTNGQYTLDRWQASVSQSSKLTVQQSSTAPTGFTNSLLVTSSSAYSVGASDYFDIDQNIEGYNIADWNWGTANAKTVTLSFWVRSSLTGTFGGGLQNNNYDRSYPFTYTISAANTWEQKSVTITGDTTGTWESTNSCGVRIRFGLGTGTNQSGTAGAWVAGGKSNVTGATSVVGTNGATFYITGVQLEVGSTATSFDYRPYGTELALCQRYYIKFVGRGTGDYSSVAVGTVASSNMAELTCFLPVELRAKPTTSFGGNVYVGDGGSYPPLSSVGSNWGGRNTFYFSAVATTSSLTVGRGAYLYTNTASTDFFALSAEL